MRLSNFFSIVSVMLISFGSIGCKKLVQITPPVTSITGNNVYVTNATAASVLTGMYATMGQGSFAAGSSSISVCAGLAADELQGTAGGSLGSSLTPFYLNALKSSSSAFWSELYSYIHRANGAIDGITASTTLSDTVKTELIGEAKFIRALSYFYLTNLFGEVPLVLSSEYQNNALVSRNAQATVYEQIINDLKSAQTALNANGYVEADAMTVYPSSSAERIRPNKYAATALLAGVYLYTGDYADAEAQASAVIGNTSLYGLVSLNTAFLKNTAEAIWQLQPTTGSYCTPDGAFLIMNAAPPASSAWLNGNLVSAFEPNDQRKINWVGSFSSGGQTYYYADKYKVKISSGPTITEYIMVLRLAEQYLIRAEAEAYLGDTTDAVSDLNVIRKRAGLGLTTASSKAALLTAIQQERRVEFFTEWGHRWLDLKRTNTADAIMDTVCAQKGGTWSPNWKLWPIYLNDIEADPNLTQNAGY